MIKKLTRTGNSLALVIDKPMLEELGIDEETELELSRSGNVLIVAAVRDAKRKRKFEESLERVNRVHGDLLKRLSK
jgi:antitoxin component of MazEF toxin-antitoxin module